MQEIEWSGESKLDQTRPIQHGAAEMIFLRFNRLLVAC
jgi:hypothetical protein